MRPPITRVLQIFALLLGAMGLVLSSAGVVGATQPERDGTIHQTLPIEGDSFQSENDCGPITEGTAWHFILNNTTVDTAGSTLTATFENAGPVTATASRTENGATHYYLGTDDGDVLTGASVSTNDGQLQLSHVCDAEDGVEDDTVTCPDGEVAPDEGELVDDDGDGMAENCVFEPVPAECPDGFVEGDETPMDTDGDGDADNCVEEDETTPTVPVPVPDVEDDDEDEDEEPAPTPEDEEPVVEVEEDVVVPVVTPATPATPTVNPATPAQPAVEAVVDRNPRVLGAQTVRTLPRTGDSSDNLVPFGLGLVLLGFGLQRTSKRFGAARAS